MKIVYCLPQLYRPGGIERIVSIKANYLAEVMGYDIVLVLADQRNEKPFYSLCDRIKVIDLGLDYDSTLTLPIWKRFLKRHALHKLHMQKLKRILYSEKPDITISTFTHEADFLPSIKDGSKKVLEFHFCRGYKRKMANVFRLGLITKIGYYYKSWQEETFIIPKYDQFVVLTKEDKDLWSGKIGNVINIPNIAEVYNDELPKLENKHAIAVGRLDGQKSFDRLIDIWTDIHKTNPDWILNIYGQGPDEQKLRDMISSNGLINVVNIFPPVKNIRDKYKNSSILLMTSTYEGWGLVLSEAMSCGLPVVAYACKCGPKDIITDNVDGYCIPNGNKDLFVAKTKCLIDNLSLRRTFGFAARRNIERYRIETVMAQWVELFNNLTN